MSSPPRLHADARQAPCGMPRAARKEAEHLFAIAADLLQGIPCNWVPDAEPRDGEPRDGEPGEPRDGEPDDSEPGDSEPGDSEPGEGSAFRQAVRTIEWLRCLVHYLATEFGVGVSPPESAMDAAAAQQRRPPKSHNRDDPGVWVVDLVTRCLFAAYSSERPSDSPILSEAELDRYRDDIANYLVARAGIPRREALRIARELDFSAVGDALPPQCKRIRVPSAKEFLRKAPRKLYRTLRRNWVGKKQRRRRGAHTDPAFEDHAAAVVLMYTALAQGHQMAMPGPVVRLLNKTFGDDLVELYASAINTNHRKHYFSMFKWCEGAFGSKGPFNAASLRRAIDSGLTKFVANPPYDEVMLRNMLECFRAELERARKEGRPLLFLFGLPNWPDAPFEQMVNEFGHFICVRFKKGVAPWVNRMHDPAQATSVPFAGIPSHLWFAAASPRGMEALGAAFDAKAFASSFDETWRAVWKCDDARRWLEEQRAAREVARSPSWRGGASPHSPSWRNTSPHSPSWKGGAPPHSPSWRSASPQKIADPRGVWDQRRNQRLAAAARRPEPRPALRPALRSVPYVAGQPSVSSWPSAQPA